jgi:hypothetical protein
LFNYAWKLEKEQDVKNGGSEVSVRESGWAAKWASVLSGKIIVRSKSFCVNLHDRFLEIWKGKYVFT